MMVRFFPPLALALSALSLLACSGGGSSGTPSGTSGGTRDNCTSSATLTVNGVAYPVTSPYRVLLTGGRYVGSGTDNGSIKVGDSEDIEIVPNATNPKVILYVEAGSNAYDARKATLTFTAWTGKELSGTFSATALRDPDEVPAQVSGSFTTSCIDTY